MNHYFTVTFHIVVCGNIFIVWHCICKNNMKSFVQSNWPDLVWSIWIQVQLNRVYFSINWILSHLLRQHVWFNLSSFLYSLYWNFWPDCFLGVCIYRHCFKYYFYGFIYLPIFLMNSRFIYSLQNIWKRVPDLYTDIQGIFGYSIDIWLHIRKTISTFQICSSLILYVFELHHHSLNSLSIKFDRYP